MATRTKAIITCAPTGAIHTPSMSPHLPVTAEQIARAAIDAAEAGAAIVHLHARDPRDGRPSQDPELFRPFLKAIRAESDAIVNITTGGSPHMTVPERMRPVTEFQPELASLNMGSMNFGLFPMLERFPNLEHAWEREHLENSRNLVFKNTFADIEGILRLGQARARDSNSSATTSATCTTWRISWTGGWCRGPCSCSRCSASWAASAATRRT